MNERDELDERMKRVMMKHTNKTNFVNFDTVFRHCQQSRNKSKRNMRHPQAVDARLFVDSSGKDIS